MVVVAVDDDRAVRPSVVRMTQRNRSPSLSTRMSAPLRIAIEEISPALQGWKTAPAAVAAAASSNVPCTEEFFRLMGCLARRRGGEGGEPSSCLKEYAFLKSCLHANGLPVAF